MGWWASTCLLLSLFQMYSDTLPLNTVNTQNYSAVEKFIWGINQNPKNAIWKWKQISHRYSDHSALGNWTTCMWRETSRAHLYILILIFLSLYVNIRINELAVGICIYSSLSVLIEKEKMLLFFELARNTQTLSCSLSDVSWFKLYRRPQERRGSHWVSFPPWTNLHLSDRHGRAGDSDWDDQGGHSHVSFKRAFYHHCDLGKTY